MFSQETVKLAKPCIEAIKKISKGKWEWEPEVGEWCIVKDKRVRRKGWDTRMGLIVSVNLSICTIKTENGLNYIIENCIPLLHWERIEEILEGMGYDVFLYDQDFGASKTANKYEATIWKPAPIDCQKEKPFTERRGETRQLALLRAVIELGKEKANEKD